MHDFFFIKHLKILNLYIFVSNMESQVDGLYVFKKVIDGLKGYLTGLQATKVLTSISRNWIVY